jgi:hypothetical protein
LNESDTIPNLNIRYFRDNNKKNLKETGWASSGHIWLGTSTVACPSEHGNESSGFLKCGNFLD